MIITRVLLTLALILGAASAVAGGSTLNLNVRAHTVSRMEYPTKSARASQGRGELNYAGSVATMVVGKPQTGLSTLGCVKYPWLCPSINSTEDVVIYRRSSIVRKLIPVQTKAGVVYVWR